MKILLVNDYSSLEGGAERSILTLRQHLREAGHDVRLLSSDAHSVGLLPQGDYLCHGSMGRTRTLLQTCNPWAVIALSRALQDFQPDVVHIKMFLTQLSPFILPQLRSIPTLYHAAWLRAICPLGTKLLPDGRDCTYPVGRACRREGCLNAVDWPLRMLQHYLLRRWQGVLRVTVANSNFTALTLQTGGFAPIVTILNVVDEMPPRPPLAQPPIALFAGRLIKTKGAQVLIRAFARVVARVPDARLVIAGQGGYLPELRRIANETGMGERVEFTGFLAPDVLECKAASAWVQVVPTLNAEPFGLVAAEAAMRGTAVIASRSGGLTEIVIPEETGLLVPPGDEIALVEALERLLLDRALCERMGSAARQHALRAFSQQRYTAQFLQQYRALAEGMQK